MNISVRGKKKVIYLSFRFQYQQHRLPTQYVCSNQTPSKDCKCSGHKLARGLAAEIERKIKEGSLLLHDYFPTSNIKNQTVRINSNITFRQYANEWLKMKKPILAHSSFASYVDKLKKVCEYIGEIKVVDIKPIQIKQIISSWSKNYLYLKSILTITNSLFNEAIQDGLITSNPCKNLQYPKISTKEIDVIEGEDVLRILSWMKEHKPNLVCYFALAFYTGMRSGEILALTWDDVDLEHHTITVNKTCTIGKLKLSTKTNKVRIIDIIPALDEYLHQQAMNTRLIGKTILLTKSKNPFVSFEIFRNAWSKCLNDLKLKHVKLYSTRHSFACNMIAAGEQPQWIAYMLGHSDLSMLFKVYGKWFKRKEGERAGIKGSQFLQMLPICDQKKN